MSAVAWYFSNFVLRTLLVDSEMMFLSLSQKQRGHLTERFNDPTSAIRRPVLLYDMSCYGLNET